MVGLAAPDPKILKMHRIEPAPRATFDLTKVAIAPRPMVRYTAQPMRMTAKAEPMMVHKAISDVRTMGGGPGKMGIKAEPRVVTLGGAAAKLLPETVKEENEEDKGAPLLNDND